MSLDAKAPAARAATERPLGRDDLRALRVGPGILVQPTVDGPLSGLDLVVKDLFDIAGHRTGAGNPDFLADARPAGLTAPAVTRLVDAGARVIGKSHTDEQAFSLSGTNVHYGTPLNSAAPGRIPGGSSSGSASAVAGGLAALGLGTDTGGSIRIPASYCGIFGLRPSHGRVPVDGLVPLAPSFDTVGLLAASGTFLERAGLVLLDAKPAAPPTGALILATDLLALADDDVAAACEAAAERLAAQSGLPLTRVRLGGARLDAWSSAYMARQMYEAWKSHGSWVTTRRPRLGPGIARRFDVARQATEAASVAADAIRTEVRAALERVLGTAGALVFPTAGTVAPPITLDAVAKDRLRGQNLGLTCVAGLAGAPTVSLPLADVDGLPVGLAVLGRPGDDEALLALAAVA